MLKNFSVYGIYQARMETIIGTVFKSAFHLLHPAPSMNSGSTQHIYVIIAIIWWYVCILIGRTVPRYTGPLEDGWGRSNGLSKTGPTKLYSVVCQPPSDHVTILRERLILPVCDKTVSFLLILYPFCDIFRIFISLLYWCIAHEENSPLIV